MYHNQTAQDAQNRNHFGGFGRNCGGFRGQKFGKHMAPWMQHLANKFGNNVPVNIEENNEAYTMSVYAAGLVKENFTVSVKEDVLSIAYKAGNNNTEDKYSHQEFAPNDFERLFQLNTKVITENISATYTDGVLKVTLPKNPETAKPAQTVNVN